jgi:hypothetical protein
MSEILAIQYTEIRRIVVLGQPKQKVQGIPSYMRSINRRIVVQAGLGINLRLCLKND